MTVTSCSSIRTWRAAHQSPSTVAPVTPANSSRVTPSVAASRTATREHRLLLAALVAADLPHVDPDELGECDAA